MLNQNHFLKRVVYQIYPKSFYSASGTETGDIRGIIEKLDYLQDLGVGVLWLCPVYASPEADNGYDISDYCSVNPRYGSMADMDELIFQAKKRDIYIIMDLVINHTSDEHEWFIRSKDPHSEYRDYYYWRKGRGKDGSKPPNNWTGFFGGETWTRDEQTGDWYLHLFASKQPDLNWNNLDVMDEVKRIMRFWLDKGIAGFRCDVINIIFKNTLCDGKKKLILTGSEHYLTTDGCHRILRELRDEVLNSYDCFNVGETVFASLNDANELTAVKDGRALELDMIFSFEHMEVDQIIVKWLKVRYKPEKMKKILRKWQESVEWNSIYFENHDQPRSISRFGAKGRFEVLSGKMLATLLLTLKGTPYIYQGQEIGMLNADYTALSDYADIESHNVYKILKGIPFLNIGAFKKIQRTSRDNARTPMQWNASEYSGFSTKAPWLRVNGNYKEINVEKSLNDADSLLNYYKSLIKLRRESDALTCGDIEFLPSPKNVFAYKRTHGDDEALIIVNMSGKKINCKKYPQIADAMKNIAPLKTNYNGGMSGEILREYESAIFKINT